MIVTFLMQIGSLLVLLADFLEVRVAHALCSTGTKVVVVLNHPC